MLTFLANMSAPLFWLGLPMLLFCVIMIVISYASSSDHAVLSDSWVVHRKQIPRYMFGVGAAMAMIAVSYGVEGINDPYVKKIIVEKQVPTPTAFVEHYDNCLNRTRDVSLEGQRKCNVFAAEQTLVDAKGPVRIVYRHPVKVVEKLVYTKLPFDKFMEGCVTVKEAQGEAAIALLDRQHTRCSTLAAEKMQNLVAIPAR